MPLVFLRNRADVDKSLEAPCDICSYELIPLPLRNAPAQAIGDTMSRWNKIDTNDDNGRSARHVVAPIVTSTCAAAHDADPAVY